MRTGALYAVVSISGAAVLALEILGTRILGPFYGVSLFLWSALITVTLAALSAGYALGGRWADRGARPARLALLLAGAGLWLVLIPPLRRPVLLLVEPLGLRPAVLAAATLLFFPPLALLGMVSPYAIRLKATDLSEVGRTAGNLFAVSTIASVASALATGFWLIPAVGVTRLTLLIGAALLAAAAIAFSSERGGRGRAALSLVAAVALAGLGARAPRAPTGAAHGGVVALRESPYAEIRVVDARDLRFLVIDGGVHTIVAREGGAPRFPYAVVLDILKHLFEGPGRLLVVGLGGGSVAKSFSADGWRVDAVEIDPAIEDVARGFFGLGPGDAATTIADGRAFLLRDGEPYDVIVFDAYGSGAIPFHLVTREAFQIARRRLREGGILALNVESVGWDDVFVRSLTATLRRDFARVVALPTGEPPNVLGNVVLLASDRPLEFDDEVLGRPFDYLGDPPRHWAVVQRNHAWDNRYEPDASGAPVLTDDKNPVDLWAERINRAARRRLHEDPNLAGLTW